MQSSRVLPAVLLFLAAAPLSCALKEEERVTMVEMHNLFRSQVSPPAADMLTMRWDEELAAFAKAYATQCIWGHNKERGRRGENLFAITEEGLDIQMAMEEWYNENEHYNLTSAACEEGQMCGHYTQVVWAATDRIGCGSHFCEKLEGVEETDIHLLVCNYQPPGNVKGRKPYKEGPRCSLCPDGYRCQNGLCEPAVGPATTTVLSPTKGVPASGAPGQAPSLRPSSDPGPEPRSETEAGGRGSPSVSPESPLFQERESTTLVPEAALEKETVPPEPQGRAWESIPEGTWEGDRGEAEEGVQVLLPSLSSSASSSQADPGQEGSPHPSAAASASPRPANPLSRDPPLPHRATGSNATGGRALALRSSGAAHLQPNTQVDGQSSSGPSCLTASLGGLLATLVVALLF
ncbi:peptidase inhibitor 16 isoform X1 [Ornithorhynchus anatinus]|uniref:Peptidase inhibitor 16 n=1 Tax=Ornithorhynchus anatinus TaxID=9258 RepID=K7EDG9_ORNAN|nr:peptidase inhibitor 16 isoform X1 [Ornithorhynchus anatinus]